MIANNVINHWLNDACLFCRPQGAPWSWVIFTQPLPLGLLPIVSLSLLMSMSSLLVLLSFLFSELTSSCLIHLLNRNLNGTTSILSLSIHVCVFSSVCMGFISISVWAQCRGFPLIGPPAEREIWHFHSFLVLANESYWIANGEKNWSLCFCL